VVLRGRDEKEWHKLMVWGGAALGTWLTICLPAHFFPHYYPAMAAAYWLSVRERGWRGCSCLLTMRAGAAAPSVD